MTPTFSIIIPAYNIGELVVDAIESCTKQKGIETSEVEIIIVNDGSTDDTFTYIQPYEGLANVIVINQKNGGLSNARNNGLELASGKYVLFLDGDDWLADSALALLKDNANENEILEFPLIYWYDENNQEPKGCNIQDGLYSTKEFLHRTLGKSQFHEIPAQKKLYPRKILREKNLRFLEGIYHEDNPFFVDVMMNTEYVRYLNIPIYYYRQNRAGSITSKRTLRNFQGVIDGVDYIISRYGFSNPDVVHLLSNMYVFQMVGDFSDDNHRKTVIRYFRSLKTKKRIISMLFNSRWRIKSQIRSFLLLIDPNVLWRVLKLM